MEYHARVANGPLCTPPAPFTRFPHMSGLCSTTASIRCKNVFARGTLSLKRASVAVRRTRASLIVRAERLISSTEVRPSSSRPPFLYLIYSFSPTNHPIHWTIILSTVSMNRTPYRRITRAGIGGKRVRTRKAPPHPPRRAATLSFFSYPSLTPPSISRSASPSRSPPLSPDRI